MYLRFDFSSSANVGYGASVSFPPSRHYHCPLIFRRIHAFLLGGTAFVNFINVQDLLLFAKTKLGVKWNMYSSDKVLQMSYANFQGKEALVEKFKNSCVMEMQVCSPLPLYPSSLAPSSPLSETLMLLETVCRTSGSQKYFTRLDRTVDNANLFLHRVMCHALDAVPTNVNGASYALIISCRIRPPREVTGVTCRWNKGSIMHTNIISLSDSFGIRRCGPVANSSLLSVYPANERTVKYFTSPRFLVIVVCLLCSIQCSRICRASDQTETFLFSFSVFFLHHPHWCTA